MTPATRKNIEKAIRQHYDRAEILGQLSQMIEFSLRDLTDDGVRKLVVKLETAKRRRNLSNRKCREHNAALRLAAE